MARRRPVPYAWREDHHRLTLSGPRATGYGFRRYSRSRGYCSCGARWPESPRTDNLTAPAVREYWLDHVEQAYYEPEDAAAVAVATVILRASRRGS